MTLDEVDKKFKTYAEFSVRVDRYFNWVNAVINHFPYMKDLHASSMELKRTEDFSKGERTPVSLLAFETIRFFNYFETTGVFNKDSFSQFETSDNQNFSYYTCYCFQWTLFENFVSESVFSFSNANLFETSITREINRCKFQTRKLFDLIQRGEVFGATPFETVLPEGWQLTPVHYDYGHLDLIREKRNNYIHGNIDVEISPGNAMVKQKEYEKSMWILRKFSENIYFLLRDKLISSP